MRWQTAASVSYTHLDVYKRQVYGHTISPHVGGGTNSTEYETVSYTHLDVYKRQTFGGVLLAVRLPTSGPPGSHGVTGGVYKARERIHRGMLIRDY